jgi:hypothetical protein
MVLLAPVIGRSPRGVKRFVNCYRLLKATVNPEELARNQQRGTFRAMMLMLSVSTGMPEHAGALLKHLRDARDGHPGAWAETAQDAIEGLASSSQWKTFRELVSQLDDEGVRSIEPLADASYHVDRFSFSAFRGTRPQRIAAQNQEASAPKRRRRSKNA